MWMVLWIVFLCPLLLSSTSATATSNQLGLLLGSCSSVCLGVRGNPLRCSKRAREEAGGQGRCSPLSSSYGTEFSRTFGKYAPASLLLALL
jgi:hypothetical protein